MGMLEAGDGLIFLKVANGVMKNKEISVRGYVGILSSIKKQENEYEGQKSIQSKIVMFDPVSGEKVQITFSDESWYAKTFYDRIGLVDLSKPFTCGVYGSKENEKVSFCYMQQDGNKLNRAEGKNVIPKPQKLKSGKDNWDNVTVLTDALVIELQEKLKTLNNVAPKATGKPSTAPVISEPSMEDKPKDDDLPF